MVEQTRKGKARYPSYQTDRELDGMRGGHQRPPFKPLPEETVMVGIYRFKPAQRVQIPIKVVLGSSEM